jgi:hypothetical protein
MTLKKPALSCGPAAKYLNGLSKAALIDVLIEQIRLASGHCDDDVTVQQCVEACAATIARRGDRPPSTDTGRKFTAADIGRIEQTFINAMNHGDIPWPANREWTLTVASRNGTTNIARWDITDPIRFIDCQPSPLSSLIGQPVELGHDLWISTGDHADPFHVTQPASGIGWTIVL